MNGKQFFISVNQTQIEVTEEVYLTYYRSKRRDRYYEHDIKIETPTYDKDGKIAGYVPSKEDSFDRLVAAGDEFIAEQEPVEDIVMRGLMSDVLHKALDRLPECDRALIDALFFSNGGKGMTEREYAALTSTHHMTVHSRKVRIFSKLKKSFVQAASAIGK